jgi:ELWxxDGT repeat protein/autotransporter-associated beta strand protein
MLADVNPGTASSNPSQTVVIGSEAYFSATDGTNGYKLWKTDGTAAGTAPICSISNIPDLANVNGELFFVGLNYSTHQYQLWKSNGTVAGTTKVADIGPPEQYGAHDFPQYLTNVNGELFFDVYDRTTQIGEHQLWKSNGTAAGTTMVAVIAPGDKVPGDFTSFNGELFFRSYDSIRGMELWKSDGTAAGTVPVKDINPGSGGSYPWQLTNVNGTLYFNANDGTHGQELWKSDGTIAGTVLAEDINPGSTGSYPRLTSVNGTLYFVSSVGTHFGLWKTDGTSAGTTRITDIIPDADTLASVDGMLYFSADDGTHGHELWKSDGTATGTTLVQDLKPGTAQYSGGYYGFVTLPRSSFPSYLTNFNGTLLFAADDGVHGKELWVLSPGVTNPQNVVGTAGDDTVRLACSLIDPNYVQVFINGNGTDPTYSAAPASFNQWRVSGGTGNDQLIIDFSNGNPLPPGGLIYDGGSGANRVILSGVSGSQSMTLAAGEVSFSNLPPIQYTAATVVLAGVNTYWGDTAVAGGTLTVATAAAIPDGTSLTIGAGAALIFDPSTVTGSAATLAASGATFAAAPGNAITAAIDSNAAMPESSTFAAIETTVAVPRLASDPGPQKKGARRSIPTDILHAAPANRLVEMKIARRVAADPTLLRGAANELDASEPDRMREIRILALDTVFAQFDL